MAISATIKAKQLNGVVPFRNSYSVYVEIDVEGLEISEVVNADEIVPEYASDDLLQAIGETEVIAWLERYGYTVTDE